MSSKRHLRRIKCERKIRYRTAAQAKSANRRFVEMGGDFLTTYVCIHCHGYHLGHAPHRVEIAIASKMGAYKARRKINA